MPDAFVPDKPADNRFHVLALTGGEPYLPELELVGFAPIAARLNRPAIMR
jgi:hypothetical protein